jgi:hypothetical protein
MEAQIVSARDWNNAAGGAMAALFLCGEVSWAIVVMIAVACINAALHSHGKGRAQ